MPPATFGNLVFVDARFEGDRLVGQCQQIRSPQGIRFSWYATEPPDGTYTLGDGVAYIYMVDELEIGRPWAARLGTAGRSYLWRDKAQGDGLTFVLLLPEGYTLGGNADPMPREAKYHNGRIAVYWRVKAIYNSTGSIRWRLAPLNGDLEAEVDQLNEWFLQREVADTRADRTHVDDYQEMRIALRDLLRDRFNNAELDDLAFDLGIDHEDLPDGDHSTRARELVSYMDRHGRLPDLAAAGRRLRPNLDWPTL